MMNRNQLRWLIWMMGLLFMAGCSSLQQTPTTTPSPLPTIDLSTDTPTPTATLTPSHTPSPTATLTATATITPSPTVPPSTATPTDTPMPTATPFITYTFSNDQWQSVEIPRAIENGLDRSWLSFINYNQPRSDADTTTETQTVYLVNPSSRVRVAVAEIPASTGDRVFWSPTGTHMTYFVEPAYDADGTLIGGLYMLDIPLNLTYRLFEMPNLNPLGIAGHTPVWSGDGRYLAVAVPTEYATDIVVMNADGSNIRNITDHPAFDLYPSFSPDGLWLAFVSDRANCPSRTPGDPDYCGDQGLPDEGSLYVKNMNTGEERKITDVKLNGAPRWITNTKLVASTGGGNALATESEIWIFDIEAGTAVQVSPTGLLSISEAWARNASRVIYQRAGTTTDMVLTDAFGQILAQSSEYIFPRYGMVADWSPDNTYIAVGGRGGQCPYGIIVMDADMQVVTPPGTNLLACDPKYAPDGQWLAFTGIRPSRVTDGRLDIYLANQNGFGATNITGDLRGQIRLVGWVGPTPAQDN